MKKNACIRKSKTKIYTIYIYIYVFIFNYVRVGPLRRWSSFIFTTIVLNSIVITLYAEQRGMADVSEYTLEGFFLKANLDQIKMQFLENIEKCIDLFH